MTEQFSYLLGNTSGSAKREDRDLPLLRQLTDAPQSLRELGVVALAQPVVRRIHFELQLSLGYDQPASIG